MSDNQLQQIGSLLLRNQQEAVRLLTEKDDRIEELEQMLDAAQHTMLVQSAEITALSAANAELGRQLREAQAGNVELDF